MTITFWPGGRFYPSGVFHAPQYCRVDNAQLFLAQDRVNLNPKNYYDTHLTSRVTIVCSQSLPFDQRRLYPSNLSAPDGGTYPVCVVSGWPVIDTKKSHAVTFENGRMAIKDDWTKVMTVSKTVQSSAVKQTLEFIAKWCGPPVQQYSFHWEPTATSQSFQSGQLRILRGLSKFGFNPPSIERPTRVLIVNKYNTCTHACSE